MVEKSGLSWIYSSSGAN